MKTSEWGLVEVESIDCTMDNSGLYVTINRIKSDKTHKQYQDSRVFVRCGIMTTKDIPLVSFQGPENDVRKHTIRWIKDFWHLEISTEHASYIGRELFRAVHDFNYVQD